MPVHQCTDLSTFCTLEMAQKRKRGAGMSLKSAKNAWVLVLLILCGIVLGGFLGMLADGVSFLRFLNYGQTFGLSSPVVLDLGVISVTFGLTIRISIASIIGVIISIVIYKLM